MPKHEEEEEVAKQGLRSRKRARTRRELEAAALALFEAKGYEDTTVEEIAASVEVSTRTFFRYFGSKEDVLFGYEEDQLAELRRIIRDCPSAATDMSALGQVLLTFANYLADEPQPLLARAALVAQNPQLIDRSLMVLRSRELTLAEELAAQAGMQGPDLRLLVLAATTMSAVNVAARAWLASGGQGSLVAIAKETLESAMNLQTPGPRRPRRRRRTEQSLKDLRSLL
jgi:AcrR family transcriptional regulator